MIRRLLLASSASVVFAFALACGPDPGGPDLYRLAINGSPTGSFLSAFVYDEATASVGFVAGGFVGVDHSRLPPSGVGRLLEYRRAQFTTRCTSNEVLWWVTGVRDSGGAMVVYAAGEGARVIRFRNGACETLETGLMFPEGMPTFWGILARAVDDVWFVGGSASPTGPRGVLVHYDGTTFERVSDLPVAAQTLNLYKVDAATDGTIIVVGERGMILYRPPGVTAWSVANANARASDNRLFTVSCARTGQPLCYAVGGSGVGLLLRYSGGAWSSLAFAEESPGLNGVAVQDANNIFIVGVDGTTIHHNGQTVGRNNYRPAMALTSATLHGVGASTTVVLAVGGELNTNTPEQRGVILVRGDDSPTFTLDGQSFMASGQLRRSLGGAGQ